MNLGQIQWTMELAVIVLLIVTICWWLLFRKAMGYSYRQLIDWFRGLPKAWRYLTDREYRERRDAIMGAVNVYGILLIKMLADSATVRLAKERSGNRSKAADAALDEYGESKRVLSKLFQDLNDEALSAISLYVHEDILEGKVPLEQVRDFYAAEKNLLTSMPYLAGEHVERFMARFARAAVQ